MKERQLHTIDTFIIHGAFTKKSQDVSAEMIGEWHEQRGINRPMGYHFYIKFDGSVHKGRDLNIVGAHAAPENTRSIGICLEGGMIEEFNGDFTDQSNWINNYTDKQHAAVLDTIRECIKKIYIAKGNVEDMNVKGHRDVEGVTKTCPGFDANEKYGWIFA